MVSIPKPISIYELMKQNLGIKRPATSLAGYLGIINPITFPSSLRPTNSLASERHKKTQYSKTEVSFVSKIQNLGYMQCCKP
jgi:hypothetical protein